MDPIESSNCPVCGYELDFLFWKDDSPSDEICPCCGIQFGYADSGIDIDKRPKIYEKWRKHWIEEGMPWNSIGIPQPDQWNPEKQLENVSEQ